MNTAVVTFGFESNDLNILPTCRIFAFLAEWGPVTTWKPRGLPRKIMCLQMIPIWSCFMSRLNDMTVTGLFFQISKKTKIFGGSLAYGSVTRITIGSCNTYEKIIHLHNGNFSSSVDHFPTELNCLNWHTKQQICNPLEMKFCKPDAVKI